MRPKVKTLFTNESGNANKMLWSMCKALRFLTKYNLCWPLVYRFIALSSHFNSSSLVVSLTITTVTTVPVVIFIIAYNLIIKTNVTILIVTMMVVVDVIIMMI